MERRRRGDCPFDIAVILFVVVFGAGDRSMELQSSMPSLMMKKLYVCVLQMRAWSDEEVKENGGQYSFFFLSFFFFFFFR
jgi:hypothetical protein